MGKKEDKLNLWANDSSLVPQTDARKKGLQLATFQQLKKMGTDPATIRDKEMGKQYAAWLASQPQQ